MSAAFRFVLNHGYSMLFAALFAHQIGLPIPGPLLLLSAGALAAAGKLGVLALLGTTIAACVLADWVWYEAGRRGGDKVLHFMHRLTTRDPDFHDRRAKRVFARYGLPLLLVAKFLPGFDAVAPPLAGISRASRVQFLAFDATGAGLYACAYGGLGYVFSHHLDRAVAYVSQAGRLFLALVSIGTCAYLAYNVYRRVRSAQMSRHQQVPIIEPMSSGDPAGMPGRILGGQEHGD